LSWLSLIIATKGMEMTEEWGGVAGEFEENI
jgi:hypothetical protein